MTASSTLSADQTASSTVSATQTASSTVATSRDHIPVVSGGGLISSATFTRDDEATYLDSTGTLQTAAANEARTTYIDGVPLLWIDGEVMEISGRSADLDNWSGGTATVSKDAIGLDGESNTGWTVTDNNDTSLLQINNTTSIPDDSLERFVVYAFGYEASPDAYPAVELRLSGGTVLRERVVVDLENGTTIENETDGREVLAPVRFNDSWLGVIANTNNATGNTSALSVVFPACNEDGSGATVSAAQGSTIARYVGLFTGSFSLMPILTTGGTTKTVAAEVASLTNSIISSLTEGTIYAEIWSPQLTSNAARHIAELESDANNFIRAFIAADGDIDGQITSSGTSQAALAGSAHTPGTLHKVALVFGPSGFGLYVDGTQEGTGTGTVPSVDTLLIGAGLHGGIKTMNVEVNERSQASAEALTS